MRSKKRYTLYTILIILMIGIAYTACKDITPEPEHVSKTLELKLNK